MNQSTEELTQPARPGNQQLTPGETESIIALQRAEIRRLREELRQARKPEPPAEMRRKLRRAQSEACRQKNQAKLWRHRAMLKAPRA